MTETGTSMTDPKELPDTVPGQRDAAGREPEAAAIDELETLSRQLAEAETSLAGMRETLLRERADLDNQRKRMQRDLEQSLKFANEKLLRELLPVYDGIEHGLAADNADAAALREGLQLTLKALHKLGEANGLVEINPVGQPFDATQAEAMSMVESREHPPGTVLNVMQKGYMLNGRLLRPALVIVAKEPG